MDKRLNKIEELDILNTKLESFFSDFQELKSSLRDNFNIIDTKDWKKSQSNLITIYKFVKIALDYKEVQSQVLIILKKNDLKEK